MKGALLLTQGSTPMSQKEKQVIVITVHKEFVWELNTVVSHYYDTIGIRKNYHNIQTTELSSIMVSSSWDIDLGS